MWVTNHVCSIVKIKNIFVGDALKLLLFGIALPQLCSKVSAGLKPMQPMQLHWASRHGIWEDCSFFARYTLRLRIQ